jgi:WD40 repeat protein/tetratricopeptide (TPR) repeat protein
MNMAARLRSRNNPFPGLRPFREEEEHLFFGRESQIDAMVNTLATTHFLAVVGTSGSGKSSLVNCGLRPALHRGLMARAGTAWRMADFRPGSDPLGALAGALARDGVLFQGCETGGVLSLAEMIHATLGMSKLGLIDICEQARLGNNVNLLVIADQFEELFRYRHLSASQDEPGYAVPADATAFVNLLLEVREQTRCAIYVVLTMRSDFLGDCVQFSGLPEAINAGQYLLPRLTRDERRAAISGPVRVGGATISPVLLTRLVNDVGDNPDQLSILQHALNRTWACWQEKGGEGPLELAHYEAIGTMAHALDQHAEDAYVELGTARRQQICQKLFKGLTDKATDLRGVRRPTTHGTLCALAGATAAEITEVIDVFREPSRSFLMPPAGEELSPNTVIDISHESLMRVWESLRDWAEEEAQSARLYRRLAETAMLHAEGRTGLSRDPELQLALQWRKKEQPTPAWAERYHEGFEETMEFLEASVTRREEEAREQQAQRRRALEQAQALAEEQRRRAKIFRLGSIVLLLFLFLASLGLGLSWIAEKQALEAKRDAIQSKEEAERQAKIANARSSQFLGAEAVTYLNDELDLALLLAKTASENQEGASFEGRRAILSALESSPSLTAFLFGHTDSVQSVAFSPDGKLLASGSRDHTIRFWDINKRAPAGEPLVGYSDQPVSNVTFNPDGKTLASSSEDEILLWDVATGRPRGEPLSDQRQITGASALAFSTDGGTLASTSGDDIILWEVATGQPRREPLPSPKGVGKAALSLDGRIAAAYNFSDKRIYLWDPETGEPHRQPLSGLEADAVSALAFSPDGRTLAAGVVPAPDRTGARDKAKPTGGPQKTIWLWDLDGGQARDLPFSSDQGGVSELAFSREGEILASVTTAGTIQLWDVATGTSRGQPLSSHRRGKLHSLAFSPDGKTLVSGCEDGAIILWDISTGPPLSEPLPLHLEGSKVALSPDGHTLASGSTQGKIRLWDINTGQSLGGPLIAPTDNVVSLAFSPDGHTLASGSAQGKIRLWDINTGQSLRGPLTGPTDNVVVSLAFSPDGHTLASGSCGKKEGSDCAQGEIRLWDISTEQSPGGPPAILAIPMLRAVSLAFSPDGGTLASSSCSKKGGSACTEAEIRLWDFHNRRLLGAPFPSHQSFINSLSFSPDGRILASAGNDLILWDVQTRQQRGEPLRGLSEVRYLAFSPDGRILAAAGSENDVSADGEDVLVLWDLSTQRPLGLPLGDEGVSSLAFSSDSRSLISAGYNGELKWDLDVASWRARACRIANRNLTSQEWQRYFPDKLYRKTCSDFDPGPLREAIDLARAGHPEEALTRFHDAQKMDPNSDPAAEARFAALGLVERAKELARAGKLEQAVAAFRQAKDQNPGLTLDPETEARRFAFLALVNDGREFARQGKGKEAIAAFRRAADLYPNRTLNPQTEAAASVLRGRGQQLARAGQLEPAVRAFEDAKTLDPSLALDPDTEAHRLVTRGAAEGLVAKGQGLASEGKVQEALAAYAEARKLDPAAITAAALNGLCWYGSLAGHADAVMESCEASVSLEPKDGGIRDSRGLARTLTGNRQGAIEDFKFFVEWVKKDQGSNAEQRDRRRTEVQERERWIADLGAGRNPLDAATLEALRNE